MTRGAPIWASESLGTPIKMKRMPFVSSLICLLVALTGNAQEGSGTEAGGGDAPASSNKVLTDGQGSGKGHKEGDRATPKSPSTFTPSEEVSADTAIAFPIDI